MYIHLELRSAQTYIVSLNSVDVILSLCEEMDSWGIFPFGLRIFSSTHTRFCLFKKLVPKHSGY